MVNRAEIPLPEAWRQPLLRPSGDVLLCAKLARDPWMESVGRESETLIGKGFSKILQAAVLIQ